MYKNYKGDKPLLDINKIDDNKSMGKSISMENQLLESIRDYLIDELQKQAENEDLEEARRKKELQLYRQQLASKISGYKLNNIIKPQGYVCDKNIVGGKLSQGQGR